MGKFLAKVIAAYTRPQGRYINTNGLGSRVLAQFLGRVISHELGKLCEPSRQHTSGFRGRSTSYRHSNRRRHGHRGARGRAAEINGAVPFHGGSLIFISDSPNRAARHGDDPGDSLRGR